MSKLRVAIIGSTGYGGVELIRFLVHHPHVEITSVISSSTPDVPMSTIFPHLTEIITADLDAVDIPLIKSKADLVFAATPSGVSTTLIPELLEAGLKVIDLSGDFRLRRGELYEQWYKKPAADADVLKRAVYAIPELYEEQVRSLKPDQFISNPGCYPTTTSLGLVPIVKSGWADLQSIIVDAKSGVSGAGRGVNLGVHYAEINENLRVYKVNEHQHIPEIEQTLGDAIGREVVITFTTHLVPMTRGIMCTMYVNLTEDHREEDIIALYKDFYKDRPFVRVREQGVWPATKEVLGSNYCDIGFSLDQRTKRLTIISVSDNVVKGAAGQAIQNLNLMMGWEETLGLEHVPVYP